MMTRRTAIALVSGMLASAGWESVASAPAAADVNNDARRAHSSVVPGGAAVKDAGGKFIHEAVLYGNLTRLREVRASIAETESQQRLLREREAELDAQIQDLEKRLDQRTLQLLGVTR